MKQVTIKEIETTYHADFYVMSCSGLQSRKFTALSGENAQEKANNLFGEASCYGEPRIVTTQVKYLFELDGRTQKCSKSSWFEPTKKIGDTINILEDGDCIPL